MRDPDVEVVKRGVGAQPIPLKHFIICVVWIDASNDSYFPNKIYFNVAHRNRIFIDHVCRAFFSDSNTKHHPPLLYFKFSLRSSLVPSFRDITQLFLSLTKVFLLSYHLKWLA